jgi:putative PIN family toxin of toxin-antitoxin system
MIYLQALTSSQGPAAALLRALEHDEFSLHASEEILAEVRDVLSRAAIRRKSPHLTDERVSAFLSRVRLKANVASQVSKRFTLKRDPKDEKYVDLGLHVGAGYLITRDRDLLDLMDEGTEDGRAFRRAHPELVVIEPVPFLRLLELRRGDERQH